MIENLILTEQEIIVILRGNDEHFARKVPAFAFGVDKAIRRNTGQISEKSGVDMYQQSGPFLFQLTSNVISCHPFGNKAV